MKPETKHETDVDPKKKAAAEPAPAAAHPDPKAGAIARAMASTSPAAQRLKGKLAAAAVTLVMSSEDDGSARGGKARLLVSAEALKQVNHLREALLAVTDAEGA